MAKGLFIWAEVLCRYLKKSSDPVGDLSQIIKDGSVSEGHEHLHSLYGSILDRAIGTSSRNQKRYKQVVGVIIATSSFRPLPFHTLAILLSKLGIGRQTLENVIQDLSAVIVWKREQMDSAAEIYHLSFTDFVLEWASEKYRVDLKQTSTELTKACLEIIVDHPVPDEQEAALPPAEAAEELQLLSYSSEHWCRHLEHASTGDSEIQNHIESLFFDKKRSSWWLRCLEALRQLSLAPWFLLLVGKWVSEKVQCNYLVLNLLL
jgi:hypothetical protein